MLEPKQYPFEGQQLTIAQITETYFPKAKKGIVRYAIETHGIDSVKAFRAYLSRPPQRKPNKTAMNKHMGVEAASSLEKKRNRAAIDRRVGRASERVTGRIGCNWCGLQKPVGQTRIMPRGMSAPGRMCDGCFENRKTTMESK